MKTRRNAFWCLGKKRENGGETWLRTNALMIIRNTDGEGTSAHIRGTRLIFRMPRNRVFPSASESRRGALMVPLPSEQWIGGKKREYRRRSITLNLHKVILLSGGGRGHDISSVTIIPSRSVCSFTGEKTLPGINRCTGGREL